MVDIDITIFWQIINFTLLYLLLRYLLYQPVSKFLEKRREGIDSDIKKAAEKNREADELKAEYKNRLEKINEKAEIIKEEAVHIGEEHREEIIAEARKEADMIRKKTEKDIQQAQYRAKVELRDEVVDISLSAAERVLEEKLDEKGHHELINAALEKIDNGEFK